MAIVFDQVEGVVQGEASASEATPYEGSEKAEGSESESEMHELETRLGRTQRRQQRLAAD